MSLYKARFSELLLGCVSVESPFSSGADAAMFESPCARHSGAIGSFGCCVWYSAIAFCQFEPFNFSIPIDSRAI